MTPFELAEPRTLREAVALLDANETPVRAIAGGTALMLMMKAGVFQRVSGAITRNFSSPHVGLSLGSGACPNFHGSL